MEESLAGCNGEYFFSKLYPHLQKSSLFVPLNAHYVKGEESFPLDESVDSFLRGREKVFLLLGDSGAGKTMYCQQLVWRLSHDNFNEYIPLYIDLAIANNPLSELIPAYLSQRGFSANQIQQLKKTKKFLFILDGYDELNESKNLYVSNKLHEWNANIIITCRTQFLIGKENYPSYFMPFRGEHGQARLLKQMVVGTFNQEQISQYLHLHCKEKSDPGLTVEYYQKIIDSVPNLKAVISSPFLLSLAIEVIPSFSSVHLSRATQAVIYDRFFEIWFARQAKKLINTFSLEKNESELKKEFWCYAKSLAIKMQNKQQLIVAYSPPSEIFENQVEEWGEFFNTTHAYIKILYMACPLTDYGNHRYGFLHPSFVEYFSGKEIYDLSLECTTESLDSRSVENKSSSLLVSQSINTVKQEKDHFNKNSELMPVSFVVMLANDLTEFQKNQCVERLELSLSESERSLEAKKFKALLFSVIVVTKIQKDNQSIKAAANAITILNQAHECFSEVDLSSISIPGADLTGMIAHRTNFKSADLSNCIFREAYLAESCFEGANLQGVEWGEMPHFAWQTGCVSNVKFSKDGKYLLACGDDNVILVYEVETRKLIKNLAMHRERVLSVDITSDNRYLVTSSKDKTIRLWDFQTEKSWILVDFKDQDRIGVTRQYYFPVIFSPNGKTLVYSDEDQMGFYKINMAPVDSSFFRNKKMNACEVLKNGMGRVSKIEYSENMKYLAFSVRHGYFDYTTEIWDMEERKCVKVLEGYWFSFSKDTQYVAIATINKQDHSMIEVYHLPELLDEKTEKISVADEEDNVLSDIATTEKKNGLIARFKAHAAASHSVGYVGTIRDLQFLPSSSQLILASGGDDGLIFLWDVLAGDKQDPIAYFSGHKAPVTSTVFSPDGQYLVSSSGHLNLKGHETGDRLLKVWNVKQALTFQKGSNRHRGEIYSLAMSPVVSEIFTGGRDGSVKCWSAKNGQYVNTFYPYNEGQEARFREIRSVAIATNNKTNNATFITLSARGLIKAFQALNASDNGRVIGSESTSNRIALAITRDGCKLAIGSLQDRIEIYDVSNGNLLFTYPAKATQVAFSPDNSGNLLAMVGENILNVLDGHTGELIYQPKEIKSCGGTGWGAVAFSPVNNLLASAVNEYAKNQSRGKVFLWDIKEKKLFCELDSHEDYVSGLCFSSDGNYLFSGDSDGTICVTDINKKLKLYSFNVQGINRRISGFQYVANNQLITAQFDGSVKAWQFCFHKDVVSAKLLWHVSTDLSLVNANFNHALNLSHSHKLLIKQKQACLLDTEEENQAGLILALGEKFLALGLVDGAMECFDEAIAKDPFCVLAYLQKGLCYFQLGSAKHAEYAFTKAIDMSKKATDKQKAYFYRGILYKAVENYDLAFDDLEAAIHLPLLLGNSMNEAIQKEYLLVKEKKRIADVFSACQDGLSRLLRSDFKSSDVREKDQKGLTLLHHAIYFKQLDIITYLLRMGADPCLQEDEYGHTALHFAMIQDYQNDNLLLNIIELLLKKNPFVINVFNKNGWTALHQAVNLKKQNIVMYLLENEADINAKKLGSMPIPLVHALNNFDSSMFALLLDCGADYTVTSSMGQTVYDRLMTLFTEIMFQNIFAVSEKVELVGNTQQKLKQLQLMNDLLFIKYYKDGKKRPEGMEYFREASLDNKEMFNQPTSEETSSSENSNIIDMPQKTLFFQPALENRPQKMLKELTEKAGPTSKQENKGVNDNQKVIDPEQKQVTKPKTEPKEDNNKRQNDQQKPSGSKSSGCYIF